MKQVKTVLYYVVFTIILIMSLIIAIILYSQVLLFFCKDKYSQDSICFDMNYRCSVECNNFGWNYTNNHYGNYSRCSCDCDGSHYVSMCSGFAFEKDTHEFVSFGNGDFEVNST